MVGVHVVRLRRARHIVDHRDRQRHARVARLVDPQIFPKRVAGAVGLSDDVAPQIVHEMRGAIARPHIGDHTHRQLRTAIVGVGAAQGGVVRQARKAVGMIVGVTVDRAQPGVGSDIAGAVMHELTDRGCTDSDVGHPV